MRKLIIEKKKEKSLIQLTEKNEFLLARKIINNPEIIGTHTDKEIHGNEDKIKDKDMCYVCLFIARCSTRKSANHPWM